MSAGTLTLTNNSDAVTGAGTTFTSELVAGDFIVVSVGGITYTLPVKTVGSDTQVTLISKYPGPTQAGAAWRAIPRESQNMVTAELVTQTTSALRGLNYDKQNWQAVFSASGDITVILPDGSTFTGPSWKSLIDILNNIDIDAVQQLANQVRADALQVETDKQAAQSAAESASTDRSAAESANSSAQTAKTDAETAAGTATDKAAESKEAAEDAQTAKAAAELAAATVQPENLLQNANNLDDLTNKPAARQNLDVFSKEEIADMLPGFLGQIDWQEMRTALEPGTAPRDGQEVDQTGIFADLYAKALAGKLPTCTEAEWQADPLNRGCYVLESSPGKMRLPDDNGVQPGSLKIPVHVGDGGDSSVNGKMGGSALPNIKGEYSRVTAASASTSTAAVVKGAFKLGDRETVSPPSNAPSSGASSTGVPLLFDASADNDIYQDVVTYIEPNRVQGCWTVRFAAKTTNGGSIDALGLATAIAAGDAELLAKIISTNARIDYAMLDFGTMAKSERKVMDNPFGVNQPVEVIAETQRVDLTGAAVWAYSGWIFSSGGYGVLASYVEGQGIVVQCGNISMGNTSTQTGSAHQITATTAQNSLPVRVHVRKITA
ncbi:hypothetical protein NGC32_03725 [Kluyvera cryocrescens]|uniref:hypothetical protein n=1 Tax=Kluyvera cryocrescens TaxID=580 RepID=UPI002DB588DB|nr:hypothetical protein [Kluyvera cryocrescens]MEB7711832.1 hypothetical protein [Kluyvera cryocrescens]